MNNIVSEIRKRLRAKAKPLSQKDLAWARKIVGKDFNPLGVRLADVWKISRDVYKESGERLDFNRALTFSEILLQSKYQEEKFAGAGFINNFKKEFNQDTLKLFQSWIEKYCTTWAFCDSFCINVVGPFLGKNLDLVSKIEPWAKAKNLWVKRASLVVVLKISRLLKPEYILKRATPFMGSREPFLQKAVGWLLKESSKYHQKTVIHFLLKWKNKTSRLVLRYATEKIDSKIKSMILK